MTVAYLERPDTLRAPLIDVRLSPHRSMSCRTQWFLLAGLAAISLAISTLFVVAGYWPVAPFIGLDFALLAFAFHAVRRSARSYERIVVTPGEILIRQGDGEAIVHEERMPTLFTRLERDDHPEFGCLALRLRRGGASAMIATQVSSAERAGLASALEGALDRCRRGGIAAYGEPQMNPIPMSPET